MLLYLKREKTNINAVAEYDLNAKTFTVLKGSTISARIAYSEKFRGSKSIEKNRRGVVDGNVVIKDTSFKSASTSANFVTGTSTNGLTAWKDENGQTLKAILKEVEV